MTTYRSLCLAVLIVAVCVQQLKAGVAKEKGKIMKNNGTEIDSNNHDPESPWEDLIARMIYMTNGEKKKPKTDKRRLKKKVVAESLYGVPPEEPPFDEDEEGKVSEHARIMKRSVRRQKRSFQKDPYYRWPHNIVPYKIDASILTTTESSLMYAMQVYRDNTCIDWQPYTDTLAEELGHNSYVRFIDTSSGCWSYIGKIGYRQDLSLLQPGCTSIDTIVHEMGHALGMWHTHQRPDRDDYVIIEWDNIAYGAEYNFDKLQIQITTDDAPYDYGSVLHYSTQAFGNGQNTINFLDSNLEFLPYLTLNGLSFYDILDITIAYQCASHCVSPPACQYGGFVNSSCMCNCPDGLTGATCTQTDGNCGDIIVLQSSQEQTITSPNYGHGNYPTGLECVWLIQAPAGMLVSMTVDDFHVSQADDNKCYHWLETKYNLVGQPGPLLCGGPWALGTLNTPLNGEQNLMMLRFNSAEASNRDPSTGFSLRVRALNVE